ncbi:AMP-binding protein [Actinomadura namibiensis]|uniref:AMP-binding protein n=1 Tax=Actinomadura kijaniata TaxID=46161 RepID=UPI00360FE361
MELQPVPAWGTIPRMLRDQAGRHPDVAAVVAGDTRLTLAELARRARRTARALIALGVAPGDRVAVWAPNTPEWVVAAYGIWDAGGVIAPLSTRFKGIEAAGLLRATGARVLLVAEGFMGVSYLDMIADADLPELEHTVLLTGTSPVPAPWPGTTSSRAARRSPRRRPRSARGRSPPTTSPRSWRRPAPPARPRA